MPKVRAELKRSIYKLDKHIFYSVYHYTLNYIDWKSEAAVLIGIAPINMDGMPHASSIGSAAERQAIQLAELTEKTDKIDSVIDRVGGDLSKWLRLGVTREDMTYNRLRTTYGIPCGKNQYYTLRRKFYYEMAKEMRMI